MEAPTATVSFLGQEVVVLDEEVVPIAGQEAAGEMFCIVEEENCVVEDVDWGAEEVACRLSSRLSPKVLPVQQGGMPV